MRKSYILLFVLLFLMLLASCSSEDKSEKSKETMSFGLLVTESGLGDASYSDSALRGLEKARDELGITFDYREPVERDFKEQLQELIDRDYDVIIGLGFNAQSAINELADQYPKKQFILLDADSDRENVISISFKVDEGSYLIGMLAGMKTKSDTVGFIGGEKLPAIQEFEQGFREGVKKVNKNAKVLVDYTGTFGDDKAGKDTANKQIKKGADFLFPVAGFTGIGALTEAQKKNIYAFGVDSDQFFVAEKAVVSSMLKNIDIALYNIVKEIADGKAVTGEHLELGIKEEGVGLAPIRIIKLSHNEQQKLNAVMEKGVD
ncbi:MAG: BMP family ABC transporter substrate-binding protein [Virgibacillus proomii]|jgi:basic membrane protein A and related proteins